MNNRRNNSKNFILVFAALLSAFGPFMTDLYLPAFPQMKEYCALRRDTAIDPAFLCRYGDAYFRLFGFGYGTGEYRQRFGNARLLPILICRIGSAVGRDGGDHSHFRSGDTDSQHDNGGTCTLLAAA